MRIIPIAICQMGHCTLGWALNTGELQKAFATFD